MNLLRQEVTHHPSPSVCIEKSLYFLKPLEDVITIR
jgi:hypothetical protein